MRKRTLVATVGAAGALTLTGIGVALADPTTTPSPSPSTSPSTSAPGDNTDVQDRHQAIEKALGGLVQDGTLTQDQVGRVADQLDDAPGVGPWWGWDDNGHHGWDGDEDQSWDAAAQALGMTTQQLEDALSHEGTSLADVAQQRGVPKQTVSDAMVAAAEKGIADRVADGSLTQQRADELKAKLPDWIANSIDSDWWSHRAADHD